MVLSRCAAVLLCTGLAVSAAQVQVPQLKQWPGLGALLPPLRAGEIYTETANGCGVVMYASDVKNLPPAQTAQPTADSQAPTAAVESPASLAQQFMRGMAWTGDCVHGLAHGVGVLTAPADVATVIDYKQEFAYGRVLAKTTRPSAYSAANTILDYRTQDRGQVSIPGWSEPYSPRFGDFIAGEAMTQLIVFDFVDGATSMIIVSAFKKECMSLEGTKPRGCSYDKNYPVFGVNVTTVLGKEQRRVDTLCPNARNSDQCEATWQKIAGPFIAKIKPRIAQAEAEDAALRTELERMHGSHALNFRVNEMARQAQAQEGLARRQATARAAETEIEKQRAAAAAAERAAQEKAERAFKAKLTSLNAGQLYVLADELKAAGKSQQARAALRALIERFPDHALAASAATALAALK